MSDTNNTRGTRSGTNLFVELFVTVKALLRMEEVVRSSRVNEGPSDILLVTSAMKPRNLIQAMIPWK